MKAGVIAGCVAGLVLCAGPAFAQAIPTPILPSPTPQGNIVVVPTPGPALPAPSLPPAVFGPTQAQTPGPPAPTPAPGNLPVPLNVPNPQIGNGSIKPPTVPGVIDPGPPPNNDSAVCTASWYDLPGKAVCSMVKQAHKDTASSLKNLRRVLQIPDITANPEFQMIYGYVWPVVDGLIFLMFVYGCCLVLANEWSGFEARQLAVRTVLALAGANFIIPVLGGAIRASNSIVAAILTVDPVALQPNGDPTTQGIAFAVLGVFLMLIALALLILNLINWSVLGVGAGFGGLCNAFMITDQTDEAAKQWWRMVFWMCASPVIQAFALVLLTQVFLNSSNLSGNGLLFDLTQRIAAFLVLLVIPLVCLRKATSGHREGTSLLRKLVMIRKLATKGI